MDSSENSLLVLLSKEEYYFLYDRPSFPELLESLLEHRAPPEERQEGYLNVIHSREIARGLISKNYQEI